jgi:hypothetical protein
VEVVSYSVCVMAITTNVTARDCGADDPMTKRQKAQVFYKAPRRAQPDRLNTNSEEAEKAYEA